MEDGGERKKKTENANSDTDLVTGEWAGWRRPKYTHMKIPVLPPFEMRCRIWKIWDTLYSLTPQRAGFHRISVIDYMSMN